MLRECCVARFLLDQQTVWHTHFPTLRGRTHASIVGYLCREGRRGATAQQLYGAIQQHFQIDDSTVRQRVADVYRLQYLQIDPPDSRVTGRTILTPSATLLDAHAAYTDALADRLCAAATAMEPGNRFAPPAALTEAQRQSVHTLLRNYTTAWLDAADLFLESAKLPPARRLEARRRLMTTSYWTSMHRAIEERYTMLESGHDDGLLADQLAAAVFALNGQGNATVREHINALLALGLFERRSDRALRIALSPAATDAFHAMLAAFARETIEVASTLDTGEQAAERTARFHAPPIDPEATLGGLRFHLVIVAPASAACRIALTTKPLIVGRSKPADLVLPTAEVSRKHCRIEVSHGTVVATDLESTNGTFVDGVRIATPTPLRPGCTLRIGIYDIAIETGGSVAA
ncbi:MAG: FHA domain-containing protein [Rhodospirillales bacterium]